MYQDEKTIVVQCGREISSEEIETILCAVDDLGKLSRKTLAEAICEQLGWFTATGSYKVDACMKLLERLEARGILKLPAKRQKRGGPVSFLKEALPVDADECREISGSLSDIGPVKLQVVSEHDELSAWNEMVARYHYLGYCKPIGCFLRYFIKAPGVGILGCMLFAGAARSLTTRDAWIGWTPRQRLSNLAWVINNSRFLILPSVRISHLASHVLGQLERRVSDDWEKQWGYRPVLMETFVDPLHFRGTCYKAANWQYLGNSTGVGLPRRGRVYQTTAKMLFVRPLVTDFRAYLCSDRLVGRVWE